MSKAKKKMKTPSFSLLLTCCFLFALLNTSRANEADQLRKFINSKSSSWFLQSDSRADLDATEPVSPVYMSSQVGLMEADKIEALPGQPEGVNFNQYAGYVTVDPKKERALFYYFVESPYNSSTKPLVLWLNGGPGCSSFGYGAMQELGPFRVERDGKTLSRNQYAWNNVANVLFLESPAGVGFSYSNTSTDYTSNGDKRTAKDSYTFLVNWLKRFPQYKSRDFFITGESYVGHYAPQLASLILQQNKLPNHTVINLQGIAIGNAYVDTKTNDQGEYEFLWSHALISDEAYAEVLQACNFISTEEDSTSCLTAANNARATSGNIDEYNIYAPICLHAENRTKSSLAMADFDPCTEDYVTSYLNNPKVHEALHVDITKSTIPWQGCSDAVGYSWKDAPASVLPLIKKLIGSNETRLWLYSGDVDGVCSTAATKYAIKELKLPVRDSWKAWYYNEQVGGYVVGYQGLVFVTVRGAGHMVPSYQPERALALISSFIQGKLPSTT
ncbi:serine carboxypeptidase 1-like [Phoenix dactylifera]|uniref:Serine carboxypeptidase 1-like n=1 Tax=Phoenix dactylifera TaxID=42345 RepID=A0A8B7MWZ7_PHODC|nr:serine carboxypeptidase 1-like [Phoenix dactylifera]